MCCDPMKRWPRVTLPLRMPSISKGTTSPSKVQMMEWSGRTQRKRARTPAHGLGPGEFADRVRHDLRDDLGRRAAGPAHDGEIELALLVVLHLELVEAEARGLQEAVDGGLGRVDARALPLLVDIRRLGVEPFDREHEPARAAMGLRALIGEARLDQRIGDHLAQVVRRLLLHAGGDFLGKQFDQKFRHQGTPGGPRD